MQHNKTTQMQFSYIKTGGFTLLELILSIVLLGIITIVSTQFYKHVVTGYADTQLRNDLANTGRLAIERVGRELRNAMPNTIRVSNNCVEFMPVAGSGQYQDQAITYSVMPLQTSSPLPVNSFTSSANRFDVLDLNFTAVGGINYHLIVYPLGPGTGSDDPYAGTDPGPRFSYLNQSTVNLPAGITLVRMTGGPHLFSRYSPQQRVFIVSDPVSFCVVGTNLNRYEAYGINATQGTPPSGTAELLAQTIQLNDGGAITPFTYTTGTLFTNAVVHLDFRFMQTDHLSNQTWVRLSHEFQIRNVP